MTKLGLKRVRPCNQVHVWWIHLDQPAERVCRAFRLLDQSECSRANQFLVPVIRDRFVWGRAMVRSILGAYLHRDPAQLHISTGPNGKPQISEESRLQFNLSHTGCAGILAIAFGQQVGVDIELLKSLPELDAIACRFFSPEECSAIAGTPQEEQLLAFFRCWTRKEAYLKALADGLSRPLDSFSVTCRSADARLTACDRRPGEVDRWLLHELQTPPGFVASVALERVDQLPHANPACSDRRPSIQVQYMNCWPGRESKPILRSIHRSAADSLALR